MKMSLKTRTILPVQVILFVVMTGLAFFNYASQVSQLNNEVEDALNGALNTGHTIIENNLSLYQQMATLVAEMPTAQGIFANGNRNRLFAEFSPAFQSLKKRFNLFQFQFHKSPAVSFLRMNDPKKFGDDLSSFRHTVLFVNTQKAGVRGLETGRTGIGLRGVEPIFYKGRHFGSVEFGGDLLPVLENIKRAFGVEVGISLSQPAAAIVFPDWQKKTRPLGEYIPYFSTRPEVTQGVLSAELFRAAETATKDRALVDQAYSFGRDYSVAVSPLLDYAGQKVGYLYILKDRTETLGKIRRTLIINLAVYITILIIVSLAIGLAITRNVIDPVVGLTRTADEISMGKLSEKVEVPGKDDEIATLAKSIDRMRVSMKKLME
jgi:methyl-accepting chemotaxis protein